MKRWAVLFLAMTTGCTMVDAAKLPQPGGLEPFVTTGDIGDPYDSLGLVQVNHSGVVLLGFFEPADTALESVINKTLLPKVREMGGDGVINVRFERTQYSTVTRVLFAFPLFLFPLPADANVRGEVVRLRK